HLERVPVIIASEHDSPLSFSRLSCLCCRYQLISFPVCPPIAAVRFRRNALLCQLLYQPATRWVSLAHDRLTLPLEVQDDTATPRSRRDFLARLDFLARAHSAGRELLLLTAFRYA